MIAIATILVLLIGAESISRLVWAEDVNDQCMVEAENGKPKPNCTGVIKTAEGPWVQDQYNECGYRATGPCGTVPIEARRIAVIGSSTSFGYLVPFDHIWSVEAGQIITRQCGHPIDVQSLIGIKPDRSGFVGNLNDIATRMLPQAVALHPQVIALVIAPFDLFEMPDGGFDPIAFQQHVSDQPPIPPRVGLMDYGKALVANSRAVKVLQHFMFRDAASYVNTYLRYGDHAAFMRPPLSADWQARLNYLDGAVRYISTQLNSTGISMLLIYAPQQAQADIIADNMQIAGVDAEALDHAIGSIAQKYNVLFTDGALAFSGKNAPEYFYRADGHLNEAGHALLGNAVATTLISAHLPNFCQKGS